MFSVNNYWADSGYCCDSLTVRAHCQRQVAIFLFIIVGLTMHATILAYMFSLLEMGKITVPLSPTVAVENNIVFTQEFLLNLLKAAFPHLNK